MINSPTIITHDLWVFRQYFPILPLASLYTGSLHPGDAQIPNIVDADKGGQEVYVLREPG